MATIRVVHPFPVPALSFFSHANLSVASALPLLAYGGLLAFSPEEYAEISGEAEARDAATNTSLSLAVRGHGLRMLGVGFTTLVLSQVEDPAAQALIAKAKVITNSISLVYEILAAQAGKRKNPLVPIVTTGVFTVLWAIRAFAIYY